MLTAVEVRRRFCYDPMTGLVTHRTRAAFRIHVGDAAGHKNKDGYVQVSVNNKKYLLHRVIWLYVHGVWPCHEIDHINGVRSDNRIANLRNVSHLMNQENTRSPNRNNATGLLGVHWKGKSKSNPWAAQIKVRGVRHHLGMFSTPEAAHAAYIEAKRKLHEGCSI